MIFLSQKDYKQSRYRNLCTQTVIPINSKDEIIVITGALDGPIQSSVQVMYSKENKSEYSLHWIICYFSDVYDKKDYELKSIQTEQGFLSPTQVFFINRFILFPVSEKEMKQKIKL